jgi:DNA adenine methylase
MKYMGSKNAIAKEIIPIMETVRNGRTWVEPFVGGANMIDKVDGKRIGNDLNHYLIAMWKALQNGWKMPDFISETEYKDLQSNKDSRQPELVAFVGFNTSFGGKWFGGYARGKNNKGEQRNYTIEGKRNILKQLPKLSGVQFTSMPYWEMKIPDNSLIYCDPPYEGTTKYKDGFNHIQFWDWCRQKAKEGHIVFVSEYNAPNDFKCVWSKTLTCDLAKSDKDRTEKLFTPNSFEKTEERGLFSFMDLPTNVD